MKKLKKTSRKKIRKFEEVTRKLSADYKGVTYIHLLEVIQALYFQGRYDLVSSICDAAVKDVDDLDH